MFKPLIVYYSRTGVTQNVARTIAHETGWDHDPIIDSIERKGVVGYLRAGWDAMASHLTPLEAPLIDPKDRPLVVLGTPIWNASISPAVRTYLDQHGRRLRAVAFFVTSGGTSGQRALRQMEELAHKPPLATLVITEREIARALHLPLIRRFISELEHFAGRARHERQEEQVYSR
jgi:menaquinone-dependent protoporphyrinogen IX oxidase